MKPPIKERIIGLPFVTFLTNDEFKNSIDEVRSLLKDMPFAVNGESIISEPHVVGMPPPTIDGTPPDLANVKISVDRTWRLKLDDNFYFQIMKRGISFHHVVNDVDNAGVFADLLNFYTQLVSKIACIFDLAKRVDRIEELFLNRMETEELHDYITRAENGSRLNITGILNFPGIGVHAHGMAPCPPTFQSTSYYIEGSPNIKLGLDLTIPKVQTDEWAIQLNLRGVVNMIRLSSDNDWGASSLQGIHGHIFSLFKTIIAEKAYSSMNIKC